MLTRGSLGDQIGRVERELSAVGSGAALFVVPAVGAEVLADLLLEGDLVVEAHGLRCSRIASALNPKRERWIPQHRLLQSLQGRRQEPTRSSGWLNLQLEDGLQNVRRRDEEGSGTSQQGRTWRSAYHPSPPSNYKAVQFLHTPPYASHPLLGRTPKIERVCAHTGMFTT